MNMLKDQTKSVGSSCFKISFNAILDNRSNWKIHSVPTSSTPVAGVMQQSQWMEYGTEFYHKQDK